MIRQWHAQFIGNPEAIGESSLQRPPKANGWPLPLVAVKRFVTISVITLHVVVNRMNCFLLEGAC